MTRSLLIFLLLGAAVDCRLANAQDPLKCSLDPKQFKPKARAEGLAELVGDVLINCTGGPATSAGAAIPAYDMTLTFNAKVASRIIGTDKVAGWSEALVLLDEPPVGVQYPCEQPNGVCTGTEPVSGDYYGDGSAANPGPNRNVFQGAVGAGNTLVFKSIPVDPLNVLPPALSMIRFRFTDIRLDATSLPAGTTDLKMTSMSITGPAGTITVTIPDGSNVLATAQASLTATVRDAANANVSSSGVTLPVAAAVNLARVATLRFAATFAGAEMARTTAYSDADSTPTPADQNDVPGGAALGTESGFYNSSFGSYGARGNLGKAGLADSGTRYMAVINNIPVGFKVYVDIHNSTAATGSTARLIKTDPSGAGAFAAAASTDTVVKDKHEVVQLAVNGGKAIAVWEVLRNTLNAVGTYDFGVYLSYPAAATAPASTDIQMMYAPTGGNATPPANATPPTNAIPVFDGTTATSLNLFTYSLSGSLPDPGTTTGTPSRPGTPTPPTPGTPPTLAVLPLSMSFKATIGGQNPPPQYMQISSPGQPMGFSISSGGTIPLQPLPADGVTYKLVNITVDPKGMTDGTYQDTLTVTNTVDGTSTQVAVTFTLNATPQISSLSAPSVQAGAPGFTLTVNGSNLTDVCVIRWNGTALATTYVRAGQLKAQIPASAIAAAGSAAITVGTPDGAVSQPVSLTIESFAINSLSPARASAGDAGFTLTIGGSGFPAGSTVTFAGTVLTANSVTSTQIAADVPASLVAKEGPVPVSVSSPGGTVSNSLSFTVAPVFQIDKLSPSVVMVGGPSFTLELSGAGFVSGTTVQVGTAALRPNSLAADKIVVTVQAGMIAQAGSLPVSVLRPDLPPSASVALTVSALPVITALDPASATLKSPSFTLSVAGVGFLTGATVRWNAQALATTLVSPTQLTAVVPAELVVSLGSALIDVSSGGDTFSSAKMIRIVPPGPPTLTTVSPAAVPLGAPVSLTLTGTGFASGCAVVFTPPSGAAIRIVTGSCTPTQVVVRLPGSVLGQSGSGQIQIANPDGLSSASMQVTLGLPPFPGLSFAAPVSAPSGQDLPLSLSLNGSYPVAIQGTLTMTFAPDGNMPDDPAIQFQNGSRVFAFSIPAGTQPEIQVAMKSGTIAGLIAITPVFNAGGQDITPPDGVTQQIEIARAAPSISQFTCTRTASGFVAVAEGFTNTRWATQASFDLQSDAGASLGTAELGAATPLLFSVWFGSDQAAAAGGLFRYTQTFTTQFDALKIASATVTLSNTIGTSTTASCQLQ